VTVVFVAGQMLCIVLPLAELAVLFSLGGINLCGVPSSRDLGVTVTSDLSPSIHVHNVVVKAHQRSNAIQYTPLLSV